MKKHYFVLKKIHLNFRLFKKFVRFYYVLSTFRSFKSDLISSLLIGFHHARDTGTLLGHWHHIWNNT